MKNKENEKYVKWGLTALVVALISITFFLAASNMHGVGRTLKSLTNILMPFVYGGVLAYLTAPLCNRLQAWFLRRFRGKKGLASGLSITISLTAAVLIVLAVLLLILPQLIQSLIDLIRALPGQVESLLARINAWVEEHPEYNQQWSQISAEVDARINHLLKEDLPATLQLILSTAVSQVGNVLGILKNFLLGVIVAAYLLVRRGQLAAQCTLIVHSAFPPFWADWIEQEARLADRMFNGFLMGKLLDSAIIGVLCFIGCLVMGFKSPLLIASIVGVTNIIPFFGPFIGAVPCALLLLLENPVHCLMFVIFILILQQLDGNVIGPRILGNTTGLGSFWVMFGIVFFGGVWGITGMIIGVPLMALLYDIARRLTDYGLKKRGRGDLAQAYDSRYHQEPEPVRGKRKAGRRNQGKTE